ncbi:hypothetical protein [Streptomyces sp. NRRL S-87]|uniref:hypothetical protein n=1 Tax=Streptomyces sp. NRRL S-87 TaxID=1463920 RepID=UPI001F47DC36|nr:hypothetical protein [Streptomyces sp. NRRL S-87]
MYAARGPRRPLARTPDGDYTLTDPETGQVRHFDADGRIEQITDRNGNFAQFEYDHAGTPTGVRHSGGYHLLLETSEGRVTALSLAGGGRLLDYGYTDGHLTEVVNSSGLPLRFEYDDRARITSWTDTNGSRYDYAYDDEDRCTAEGGAAGHYALTISYGPTDPATGHRVTTTTTAAGQVRRYAVDGRCRIVSETGATGAVTRSAYDHRDRLASRTDPLGRTTRFHRDEYGRLTGVVRPDGSELTTRYDDQGRPELQTRADRTTWRHTYDERGNRLTLTNPAGATTCCTYDEHGHLTSVTDALGGTTRIRTDRAGLPVRPGRLPHHAVRRRQHVDVPYNTFVFSLVFGGVAGLRVRGLLADERREVSLEPLPDGRLAVSVVGPHRSLAFTAATLAFAAPAVRLQGGV